MESLRSFYFCLVAMPLALDMVTAITPPMSTRRMAARITRTSIAITTTSAHMHIDHRAVMVCMVIIDLHRAGTGPMARTSLAAVDSIMVMASAK